MKKKNTTEITDSAPKTDATEDSKSGGLILYTPGALPGNRPISSSNFKISEMFSSAGNRPIAASNITVLRTSADNRPTISSNQSIHHMISISGDRPIFASTLDIYEILAGGRPIASNDIDDPEALMSYLD